MMLTNIILSTILAFQPISQAEYQDNTRFASDDQLIKVMYFVQSLNLIYKDIYDYTKPNLYKTQYIKNKYQSPGEINSVANFFFQYNLWDTAFLCANAFNLFMFSLDDTVFKNYSALLAIAEVLAISTWDPWMSGEINVKSTLFVYTF